MKLFNKKMNTKYSIHPDVEKEVMDHLKNNDIEELRIGFYTSNYRWWSRLIKWWTNSPYSHCEFIVKVKGNYYLLGISDDQQVRVVQYDLDTKYDKWDFVDITEYATTPQEGTDSVLTYNIYKFFDSTMGARYDWRGILWSCIFARRTDDPNKYTCSEWVINALDNHKGMHKVFPTKYQCILPYDVYDYVRKFIPNERLIYTADSKEVKRVYNNIES